MITLTPDAIPRLLVLAVAFGLWIGFAYVYGRWWTWKTNKKRRAAHKRRKAR